MIAVAGALAFALAQPYLRFVTVGGSPGQMMWLRLGVAGVIVLALGNAGVTSVAFLGDLRSLRSMFAEVRPGDPAFLTADEEAALSWMRERSPRDAAFLRSPRPFGTEPILILGWRRLYLGMAESFYNEIQFRSPGHPSAPPAVWAELNRREALQRTVFSERSLAPDSLALLRDFPRPLYIWWGTRLGGSVLSPTLLTPGVRRSAIAARHIRGGRAVPEWRSGSAGAAPGGGRGPAFARSRARPYDGTSSVGTTLHAASQRGVVHLLEAAVRNPGWLEIPARTRMRLRCGPGAEPSGVGPA